MDLGSNVERAMSFKWVSFAWRRRGELMRGFCDL